MQPQFTFLSITIDDIVFKKKAIRLCSLSMIYQFFFNNHYISNLEGEHKSVIIKIKIQMIHDEL